jgi:hypothetical protein
MRIGIFENLSFFESAILNFFILIESGTNYGIEWMGLNFYDNRGFQPKAA